MHSSEIQHATRTFIAISFAVFGSHQILYARFVTRVIGTLPLWVPWQPFLVVPTGIALVAAGVALGLNRRSVAVAFGAASLAFALLTHLPSAPADPAGANRSIRSVPSGKGLMIAGCWTKASL